MAYVIVGLIRELKYFVQEQDGCYYLNGLQENAKQYPTEESARTPKQEFQNKFGIKLLIQEVLPKSNHPTT